LSHESYRKLLSGRNGGLGAMLLRFFLAVAAIGYRLAIELRNFLYSKGWLKAHKVNAIVFSIGNITAGGTGKTPLVIWLCNEINQKSKIKNQKYACAILTRGYKATQNSKLKTQNYGDEPAILTESCPHAKIVINPDRVAGAVEAVNKFGAKVLIMDDGFQHRRLARDLDIVTIDATLPFGYGKLLPAGLLREPVTVLKRAHAAIITRCNQTTEAKLAEIEKMLPQINPNIIIARSIHAAMYTKSTENKKISLEELKDKKIFAFCGIGNPDAFLETIRGLGCRLAGSKIYDDHHHYTGNDIADIYKQARRLEADLILTTQKDWSKLPIENRKSKIDITFAYLAIELKFTSGEERLRALIENTLADKISSK